MKLMGIAVGRQTVGCGGLVNLVLFIEIDEECLSTCTVEVDLGCVEVGGICQWFRIVERYGDDSVVFTGDRLEI